MLSVVGAIGAITRRVALNVVLGSADIFVAGGKTVGIDIALALLHCVAV